MRLDKFLANENIGSRKEVGVLVRSGAVTVNGQAVKKADLQIDPERDTICVNGRAIQYNRYVYLLMNKPAGVLTATRDNRTKTVLDLVPETLRRKDLFPAGRLDKDTTGMLILTDDGDFAHRMLAPKSHVLKRYEAVLDLPVEAADIRRFAEGIQSGEDLFAPALLEIDPEDPHRAWVEIREGKFHQVKRMFLACGKTVTALRRLSIGALVLEETLPAGAVRVMTPEEAGLVFQKAKPQNND
ncbi:MAG: rRNA pseudouridine synthase [Clostridia bacterium]|nr:rRNA pseudouridine synthase [Clostridia bacterium]